MVLEQIPMMRLILGFSKKIKEENKNGKNTKINNQKKINLNINNGTSLTKEVYIEVFPVQLEEQSLLISNWYFPEEFKHMNNGKEVIEGSRKYKKCKKEVLTTAAAYGQNVWLLYEKGEPYIDADGNIAFNFQKMDKSIEEMLSCLPVKFIEGNHIAKRSTNRWTDPFWVLTPIQDKDGKFNFVKLSLDDQRAVNYVKKKNLTSL